MKTGKITAFEFAGTASLKHGQFNRYKVHFADGQEWMFLTKGDFKKTIGEEVTYEITNNEYKTAKFTQMQQPQTSYGGNTKDVTISKLACLKASAEFHAQRGQSEDADVINTAQLYYNWIKG